MAPRKCDDFQKTNGTVSCQGLSGRALHGKIVLDHLSERFFINKFYLTKIFKETYGTTINSYLISKRITGAKQLLRFTDKTVDEIGNAVGMEDANYFSRMFRKVEGISPSEYRKQW